MKKIINIFLFLCFLNTYNTYSQTNFREGFEATDPVPKNATLSIEERKTIHQNFLDNAIEEKNELHHLYGLIYMFYNSLRAHNYSEATSYLLEAESIAEASGDVGWQGWITYRRGILYDVLNKKEEAIPTYKLAAELCGTAKDSLCFTESLEQVGGNYAQLDSFDIAYEYYNMVLPLAEKYENEENYSITLNNFAILLSRSDKPEEAIPYFEQCIVLNKKNQNYRVAGKAMNNLADAYRRIGNTDLAINTFKEAVEFNKTHGLLESTINNYFGLSVTYDSLKDYKAANEYLVKYIEIKDSLIGVSIKEKIADLETQYEMQKKETALQTSRLELVAKQRSLERSLGFLGFILLLSIFGLWRWRIQTRQAKLEFQKNEEHLKGLTNILLKKNKLLVDLEKQVLQFESQERSPIQAEGFDENLYNQRVLTEDDWTSFKVYFEKTYPSYLSRLRSVHPTMSEAEERLFIFIKLKLTRKEAAIILGISVDSVKKTRNRLRKRLELNREDSLEEYVCNF